MRLEASLGSLLAAAVSILAATACTRIAAAGPGPAGPGGPGGQPRVTVETLSTDPLVRGRETPLDVRAVGRDVIVTTGMVAGTPCHRVIAEVRVVDRRVEVSLALEGTGDICVQVVSEIVGRVRILDLLPGVYTVDVRAPEKAAITTVRVG